jgi:FKBP-type peptidyl-prolyl cis-trans isomerase
MKKLYSLFIMLISTTWCFGQTQWGPWMKSSCYSYLQHQIKYNRTAKIPWSKRGFQEGSYSIKFKNTSSRKMDFWFGVWINSNREHWVHKENNDQVYLRKANDDHQGYDEGPFELQPNQEIVIGRLMTNYSGPSLYIEIWRVNFYKPNGQMEKYYENCSNGSLCLSCQMVNTVSCNTDGTRQDAAQSNEGNNRSVTSPAVNADNRSSTDKLLDAYATLLGVKNSGSNRYNSGSGTSPAISERQPVVANQPPAVTEKDFAMDVTPYNPLYAKEQAERFVAGFTKRPGVLTMPSGVLYQVLSTGAGAKPTATDNVKINFRKTIVVGRQYISASVNEKGETINVGEIGPNLAEGIKLMNAGSKYCFVFPAHLAGKQPEYPAGSVTVVWVIDLLEVIK